ACLVGGRGKRCGSWPLPEVIGPLDRSPSEIPSSIQRTAIDKLRRTKENDRSFSFCSAAAGRPDRRSEVPDVPPIRLPPAAAMPPPEVTVATLRAEPVLLTRELPGRTRPYQVAEVRPQVSGLVKSLLFTEGGRVQAGEPLYQIDDAAYRAEADRAQAALVKA